MRSAAYDLSQFAPVVEQQDRPKVRVVDNPKRKKGVRAYRVRLTFLCTFLLVLMTMTVYNNMLLTETQAKVNAQQEELTRLESEYTYLNWQMDSRVSLKNAEEYAETELGLVKMSMSQVEYLNLNSDNQIIEGDLSGENGFFAKVWDAIGGLFR